MKDTKLRGALIESGFLFQSHFDNDLHVFNIKTPLNFQEKRIRDLEDKVDALLNLLGVKQVAHKERVLVKGNKEVEY